MTHEELTDLHAAVAAAETSEMKAEALNKLAIKYLELSRYNEAVLHAEKARLLARNAVSIQEEGTAYNILGNISIRRGDYQIALEQLQQALALFESLNNKRRIAMAIGNIGLVYQNLLDYPNALEYYKKALIIAEEIGNKSSVAINTGNIGTVHLHLANFTTALEYYSKSLTIYKELGSTHGVAITTGNMGTVYLNLSNYTKALEYFFEALAIFKKIGNKSGVAINTGNIGSVYSKEDFEGYDATKAEEYLHRAITMNDELGTKSQNIDVFNVLSELYANRGEGMKAYQFYKKYYLLREEVQSEEAKKQALKHDTDRKLIAERAAANERSKILDNILPPEITARLVKGETKIADSHPNVSVLFADIVGFTKLSTKLSADELIDLLDIVFTRFDTICQKHGLEKIKTIGDAYMAVCGAPVVRDNHAERAVLAALEMLEDFSIEQQFSAPINLGFRIGIHCGSVVAGIIGENKNSYDLWGDAVNTGSRMEHYGEEDKIHVSEGFVRELKVKSEQLKVKSEELKIGKEEQLLITINSSLITAFPRGEMEIKGKGMMKTYFLESRMNNQ